MNSSSGFALGVIACVVFCAMALAVVVISAVECRRLESELLPEPQPEPLPQRNPSPEPQHFLFMLYAPYDYLRRCADGEATWCLHSGRALYSAN